MKPSTCVAVLIASILSSRAAFGQGLPDPDHLMLATAPTAPTGMKETSRAARLTPIRYSNPLVAKSIKDPRVVSSTATLCILGWSFKSPDYKFPGNVRLMWGVYDSIPSAKMGALSRTWGERAVPPKSSMPSGSISGRALGDESWHSSEGSPASIVTRKGTIVVQVLIQPAGKLVGRGLVFDKVKKKDLALIESIAREALQKTDRFVRGHS